MFKPLIELNDGSILYLNKLYRVVDGVLHYQRSLGYAGFGLIVGQLLTPEQLLFVTDNHMIIKQISSDPPTIVQQVLTNSINAVVIHNNMKWLLCGDAQGFISTRNITTLQVVSQVAAHGGYNITALCKLQETGGQNGGGCNMVASGAYDKLIKIWDFSSDPPLCVWTLKGHTTGVRDVVSLSNNRLASCSYEIMLWNIHTGECINTLYVHDRPVMRLLQLRNKHLACLTYDGLLKIWNPSGCGQSTAAVAVGKETDDMVELSDGSIVISMELQGLVKWTPVFNLVQLCCSVLMEKRLVTLEEVKNSFPSELYPICQAFASFFELHSKP
eukprot:TRINITY_DN14878_c0_g1_i1.p1 TRINITY_DN14878_c0_g1~~TRINITY_DN14878_c0_g1_i1.p1  ORF type:complete len:329 (+),score=59.69 TRINITY_DN14878_c0_g1_i1:28-1014(+)